jgi:hypothetical protein
MGLKLYQSTAYDLPVAWYFYFILKGFDPLNLKKRFSAA